MFNKDSNDSIKSLKYFLLANGPYILPLTTSTPTCVCIEKYIYSCTYYQVLTWSLCHACSRLYEIKARIPRRSCCWGAELQGEYFTVLRITESPQQYSNSYYQYQPGQTQQLSKADTLLAHKGSVCLVIFLKLTYI